MLLLSHDEAFLRHDAGPGHPESPDRLTAILAHLDRAGITDASRRVAPREATREELARVHTDAHVETIRAVSERTGYLDGDTHVGKDSWEAARLAAGSTLAVADEVMAGPDRRGLCLVRPPGHHATSTRAMGFCLFNNVAVCARHLQDRHGVGRVAIVDFDVHHGNGTEEIFSTDETVLYLSTHRWPFYPGTGGPDAPEFVATVNIPLRDVTRPDEFHASFDDGMEDVRAFAPEVVLVSAGFDAHVDDPVGGLNLDVDDFARITERIVGVAEETAEGRIVSVLEGGYGLDVLGPCVEAHARALSPGEGVDGV